jgi:hypothetical protein
MNENLTRFLLTCVLVLNWISSQSQVKFTFRVTVTCNQAPLTWFVQEIEKQAPLRFYFDSVNTDSVRVTLDCKDCPMDQVLQQALHATPLNYYGLPGNRIMVVEKKHIIQPILSPDFFQKSADSTAGAVPGGTLQPKEKAVLSAGVENKLIEIGSASARASQGNIRLTGYIRDQKNGEALAGAVISSVQLPTPVMTDPYGYYSLTLKPGRYTLQISSSGMKPTKREIMIHENGKLDIEVQENIPTLKAITIVAEKNSNIRRMQMGVDKLNIKTIKKVPVLLGEPDILRVVLALPGVTTVSEASTGFNVRGGSADQNLILYNDATIYNPSHLFGFFSAFNPDAVKGVELFKSSIPGKYGGRLASVLEVSGKEGNIKKWSGNGGISPLYSKLTVEGPLDKEKTSILLGGRTTYSNWILRQLDNPVFQNSSASFSDIDLHLNHSINDRNKLDMTLYFSNDKFRLNGDTLFGYGNRNIVLRWKHNFNSRLSMAVSGGWDNYRYSVTGDEGQSTGFKLDYQVNQTHLRAHFSYTPSNRHLIEFGYNGILYNLQPGELQPDSYQSIIKPVTMPRDKGFENAVYVSDRFNINRKFSIDAGLRYSAFTAMGPREVYSYIDGLPRDPSTVTDTSYYGSGEPVKIYHGPEIRLSLRYSLGEHSSLKASYNSLRQYIHLLSNTAAISPTDIWKLCDTYIRPQLGDQLSLGYYLDLQSGVYESSVEFYYKRVRQVLDFKSGASILLNPHLETDVINTRGQAYGAELFIKKTAGKLTGWISYTWSRAQYKSDDSLVIQQINKGQYYPANYDKPHNLNVIANYRFTHRYSFSGNLVYSSGRPITIPVALFYYGGTQRVYYSERNQFRIPDYFRIDLSVTLDGNHRVNQKIHNSWTFGVYNLTGRDNPYSIYFAEENGRIQGYQLSVIGNIVPYITYNFRF